MTDFDPADPANPHYVAEANLAHAEGVSNSCLQGRCADCWNDDCACQLCGHLGYMRQQAVRDAAP